MIYKRFKFNKFTKYLFFLLTLIILVVSLLLYSYSDTRKGISRKNIPILSRPKVVPSFSEDKSLSNDDTSRKKDLDLKPYYLDKYLDTNNIGISKKEFSLTGTNLVFTGRVRKIYKESFSKSTSFFLDLNTIYNNYPVSIRFYLGDSNYNLSIRQLTKKNNSRDDVVVSNIYKPQKFLDDFYKKLEGKVISISIFVDIPESQIEEGKKRLLNLKKYNSNSNEVLTIESVINNYSLYYSNNLKFLDLYNKNLLSEKKIYKLGLVNEINLPIDL